MPTIRHLIARRTDLSTFLVHLTRDYQGTPARVNIERILQAGRLEARTPYGAAVNSLRKNRAPSVDLDTQKCVCFTETPLEHLNLLLSTISDLQRQCDFAPYGVAITKRIARNDGVNPVWYTDITPGHAWLMNAVNALIDQGIAMVTAARDTGDSSACYGDQHIASLTPYIEQMGSGQGYRKEFWWEREWRHVGDYRLPLRYIVIAPEQEHEDLEPIANAQFPRVAFIDADWGLEDIIGRLAGFTEVQVGPNV